MFVSADDVWASESVYVKCAETRHWVMPVVLPVGISPRMIRACGGAHVASSNLPMVPALLLMVFAIALLVCLSVI
jgi:hypothetical protein